MCLSSLVARFPAHWARLPRSSWSLKRVTKRRKKLPELRTAHFRASRAHSSVGGRTSMLVCSLASRESAWTSCPGHIGHIENVAAITTKAILEFMGHQPSLMSLRFFWQPRRRPWCKWKPISSRVNRQRRQHFFLRHVNALEQFTGTGMVQLRPIHRRKMRTFQSVQVKPFTHEHVSCFRFRVIFSISMFFEFWVC